MMIKSNSTNKAFIDWSAESKKVNYINSVGKKTIADCRPKIIKRPTENPTVGNPNPK